MDYNADPLGLCGMRNTFVYSYTSDVLDLLKNLIRCDGFLQGLNNLSTLVSSTVFIPITIYSKLNKL